jgi:hypothetical protein
VVDFAALTSCADLTSEEAEQAASSLADLTALLARVAEIARPEDGCPKVLMALARAAAMPWVEADLRVELTADDDTTTLALIADQGFGVRDRLLPIVRFAAPLDEFQRAVKLAPKLIEGLAIEEGDPGQLVLVRRSPPSSEKVEKAAPEDVEKVTTVIPPPDDDAVPLDIDMREPIAANGPLPYNPHTHPTRRMAVIDPEILRAATARRDPRRDDED